MKKYIILVFLVFFSSSLQANTPKVNECINDIYFANSIMTTEEDAQTKLDLIEKNILLEKYSGNSEKMNKELNFKTSYNQTHGFYMDLYDTYMYLFHEEDGWATYGNVMELLLERGIGKIINTPAKMAKLSKKQKKAYDDLLNIHDLKDYLDIYNTDRRVDLSKQIADYRESIRLGHGVTIVAHGKGDIFTAQAYEDMLIPEGNRDNSWMEEYVSWMSVGSPTREARGFHPYINFDNDILVYLSTLNVTKNPNRSYIHNAIGEYIENKTDMQFHSFDYYIGEKILFEDGYGERNISTDIGKKVIMEFLSDSIKKHRKAFSQWVVDQEIKKETEYELITVKHRYDSSITTMDGVEVYLYPLDSSKVLYYNQDKSKYVFASCDHTDTKYKYYRWISYMCTSRKDIELEVDIYGTKDVPSGQLASEELVVSDVRQRGFLQNGSCPITGSDYRAQVSAYNKDGCMAYTFDDTSGNYHSLDYIASQTYENSSTCTEYNMDSNVTEKLRALEK